ncbi:hypothetical protein GQ457_12G007230 [Hibiscus cannabinus]
MDEIFFQFSSNSDPPNTIPQDEVLDSVPTGKGRRRRLSGNSNDDDKKKSMHRDIERQRRQEMSTLYASLRTLLPLEYIKGKRAISDQMNGAMSYIKDLQKRVDELSAKRDELKKVSLDSGGFHRGGEAFPSSVVVRQSLDGAEVVVSTGLDGQALNLSRVLQLLLEEGLDVVNCISTRVDGALIHTIKLKVSDPRGVDVPYLEQKLNEEISSLTQTP